MRYLKRYESNDFDIKKEYLNDLLSDVNLDDVSFNMSRNEMIPTSNNEIFVRIKSEIKKKNKKVLGCATYECFSLSNYLEEILHFISYMYSEGYKLTDSKYGKVHGFRSEPYWYNLDIWSSKDINEILEHCKTTLDDSNICNINLNFKPYV